MFLILLLFFNFCHKNLHIFALPSSAVLKPAQAGLVESNSESVGLIGNGNRFRLRLFSGDSDSDSETEEGHLEDGRLF